MKNCKTLFVSLTLIVCVALTGFLKDTEIFYYPEYQHFFVFGIISLCISMIALIYKFKTSPEIAVSRLELSMFLWGIYLLLHAIFVIKGDHYQVFYLLSGILLFLSFTCLFGKSKLRFADVYVIFVILGIMEVFVCYLQAFEIIDSGSPYFKVSGTFFNPNITAMYLVVCIPFIISKLSGNNGNKHRVIPIFVLGLFFIGLLLLKCRSAYLGTGVIALYYLLQHRKLSEYYKIREWGTKSTLPALVLCIFIGGCLILYNYKKDSADGRIFVWKIAMQMLWEKPVSGYGYGLFEKEYNLHQAAYFSENEASKQERNNARHVYMPYNDVLEQGIQGGIGGLSIFLFSNVLMLLSAIRQKKTENAVLLLAVLLMGSVNFSVQAVPVWLLYLICAADVAAGSKTYIVENCLPATVFRIVAILAVVILTFGYLNTLSSHFHLYAARQSFRKKEYREALLNIKKSTGHIGWYEPYYRLHAQILSETGQRAPALKILQEATRFSASVNLYIHIASLLMAEKRYDEAENYLIKATCMIPSYFKARMLLLYLYQFREKEDKAKALATEILRMPYSLKNKDALDCRKLAANIIEK